MSRTKEFVRKIKLDYVEESFPTTKQKKKKSILKIVVIKDEVELFFFFSFLFFLKQHIHLTADLHKTCKEANRIKEALCMRQATNRKPKHPTPSQYKPINQNHHYT